MDQPDNLPESEIVQPGAEAGRSDSPAAPPGGPNLLSLWGAAPVLAAFSPAFYRKIARRSVLSAIGYLVVIGVLLSIVQTANLYINLSKVSREIPRLFERGEIPEITIEDGVAEVSGPEPFVVIDQDGQLIVIDTTGVYTTIDRSRYYQGMILTRTDLIVLNQGQLQAVSLTEFQDMIQQNPIVINGQTVTAFWQGFSIVFGLGSLVSLIIWHTLVRLTYLVMLGLVMWGIAALIKRGTGFNVVLITGIFASIPPLFARWLLQTVNIHFFGLYTLMFLPLWALALAFALMDPPAIDQSTSDFGGWLRSTRPLRGWRVWVGLPLVVYLLLESLFHWRLWYVSWSLTVITAGALLVISLLPLVLAQQTEPAV